MTRTAVAAILLAALGACENPAGRDGVSPSFGAATTMNMAAQRPGAAGDAAQQRLEKEFRAGTDAVVTFGFDEAVPGAAARRALATQALWLSEHPQVRLTIVGHTDLVGGEHYNLGLGLRRAQNVLEFLVSHGVARDRLIAVESQGERDPVVPTAARERRNRRAVTMVAGFTPGHAGAGLDGEYAARIYNDFQEGEIDVTEARSEVAQ